MKARRLLYGALVIIAFAALCPADTIGPLIGVGGANAPGYDITSLTFSFVSPTGGSPLGSPCEINGTADNNCFFRNDTGFKIGSVEISIDGNSRLPVNCNFSGPFDNCSVSQDNLMATFFGGAGISSGPGGKNFQIEVFGFSAGSTFNVTLIPSVPEPASATLLLGGLGVLLASWRSRKRVRA